MASSLPRERLEALRQLVHDHVSRSDVNARVRSLLGDVLERADTASGESPNVSQR